MSLSPVTIPIEPLPRDIDVSITINRPQAEIRTDMTVLVFCTPNVTTLPPNNGRFVISSTVDGLLAATGWGPSDTGWWAINAWAQQSPRPQRMAIGRVFENDVPSQLMAAQITNLDSLETVSDGAFIVTVYDSNGVPAVLNVEDIDFTGVADAAGVASAIEAAIVSGGQDGALSAGVAYGGRLVLTARGTDTTISFAETATSGTDVSSLLNFTQETGAQKWEGYTPNSLASEVANIQRALQAADSRAFVIALDRQYRDTPAQKEVADYCEANVWRMAGTFCTNSPTAYDSADTTNVGYYCQTNNYRTASTVYSSNPQQYPDIAYVISLLATNYDYESKTAKFKGTGITPESLTETQVTVLDSRNINVYTRTGNNSDFFREGKQGADTWWSDSYYGWANFIEETQVSVFNGLIRRPKTPLDVNGQGAVVNDIGQVCEKYSTQNGFLADRVEIDTTLNEEEIVYKSYEIVPSPIWQSERATRTLSAINILAFESGAIHRVLIGIDAAN